MTLQSALLAAACALLLSACGGEEPHPTAASTPPPAASPAPPAPAIDDKVDPASVPEAPWGQIPADPSTPARGDSGESAGNAAPTAGADLPPTVPTPDPAPVEGDGEQRR